MRYPSVDILRTVAIVVMVLVHFPENLSNYIPPFSGLGAPLFTFLSGVSYRLWLNGQEARGISDEQISKITIRRGLFVFGVGFAFNILIWLPEDTFNWDVLTFIGSAILLLNLLRRLPISISVLIAIISIVISPALRATAEYSSYWENGYFECDLTLTDVIIGYLATGYFPIFPWITFSLAGFITATLLFNPVQDERPAIWQFTIFGTGLFLLAMIGLQIRSYAPAIISTHILSGWHMFPPSTEYVFATIGMAMFLFAVLHQFVDLNPKLCSDVSRFRVFKTFSRYAFTIYLLHHMVHLWPLWIYGYLMGGETTAYWQNAMPVTISIPLACLFLLVCYLVLRRINPDDRYGVEGWMRWLCG